MSKIHTPFGPIQSKTDPERNVDGSLRSCVPGAESPLMTPLGRLMPQYTGDSMRRRQIPVVSFHTNGMLKTLPLQDQSTVPTPLGPMPAEQVTFHDNGRLKRIFPLNARLSGFWTQEDESALAKPQHLDTPLGPLTATLISAYFSPQGKLRSLTLWPGSTVDAPTPAGDIPTRMGLAFTDEGTLRSLEPAAPTPVPTPLGTLSAFDPDAVGITGDANSLRFAPDGSIVGLATVSNAFDVTLEDGETRRIEPPLRMSYCDGETPEPAPLFLEFSGDAVTFWADGLDPLTAPLTSVAATRFTAPLPLFSAACGVNASFM